MHANPTYTYITQAVGALQNWEGGGAGFPQSRSGAWQVATGAKNLVEFLQW